MKSNPSVRLSAIGTLIVIIGLLLDSSCGVADELVLSDGKVISGLILSATEDSVEMKAGVVLIRYAHTQVSTYRFAASDVVLMKSGDEKELKILSKEGDQVKVLVASGIDYLLNDEIKKVWYNRGHPLESTSMAATGRVFSNAPTKWAVPLGDYRPTLSIGVRLGGHVAVLKDWKDQFVFESDEGANELVLLGGETIYAPSRLIYLGLGFEYFQGKKVEVVGGIDDQLSALLYFVTIGLATSPRSQPDLALGGALDVGYLSATETVKMSGVTTKGTGVTFAVRPKFRATYLAKRNFLLGTDLGFLFANAKDIKLHDVSIPGYSLDFSGASFTISIAYVTNL